MTSYRRGGKCCQPKCPKGFRVFRGLWLELRPHALKASALPTALHPVMKFSNCGQTCGHGHFLTIGFAKILPASASVSARCGLRLFPSWMGGVCSQITCATNCATPGYSVFLHDTMRRRKKQVFRVCGRRCGHARFCESFPTGEFPPQATVPRTSGISHSEEWMGRLSSQITCAANCATPGHRHFSRPGAFFHTRAAMRWAIRCVGTLTLSFTEPETARRALFILLYFTGFSAKVKSIRSFRLVCRKGRPEAPWPPAGLTGSLHFVTKS